MNEATETYNTNGYFPMSVVAYYKSGVPTAEASFGGPCQFSASYINAFTAIHELAHCLGTGTYWPWQYNQFGGQWTGTHASQRIQLYGGAGAGGNYTLTFVGAGGAGAQGVIVIIYVN